MTAEELAYYWPIQQEKQWNLVKYQNNTELKNYLYGNRKFIPASAKANADSSVRVINSRFDWDKAQFEIEKRLHKEYLEYKYALWSQWQKQGRQIIHFSDELLTMLQHTDVEAISIGDLKAPHQTFYLSLKPLQIPFVEGDTQYVEGVYIHEVGNFEIQKEDGTEGLAENTFQLDFVGDYESYFLRWGDSIGEEFYSSISRFSLNHISEYNELTVGDSIATELKYFANRCQEIDPQKAVEIQIAYERFIRRIIPVTVNTLIYLSQRIEHPLRKFPRDLPDRLASILRKSNNKSQREAAYKSILNNSYLQLSFYGQQYTGSEVESKTGQSKKSHWRRGHWRKLPIGSSASNHRLIWIKPTIVNKQLGGSQKGQIHHVNKSSEL